MGGRSSTFDELFSLLPQSSSAAHVIIIGLHNAGKETIMHAMRFKERVEKIPVVGMPIVTVKSGGMVHITAWDVGGPGKIRCMWEHYFSVAKGIVFVVDSGDKDALPEAKEELHTILNNKKLTGVPLMIMANKQDLQETMLIPEMSQFLGLCDLKRMWDIIGTCGLSGDGLYEAIKGLVDMIIIHQREIE